MSDITHVIGIGTGRSGTTSLAHLLDGCDGVHVTHEDMPAIAWHKTERFVQGALSYWEALSEPRDATHVGDVAAWHLNYVEDYIRELPDVRVIATWRAEDAVVDSWLRVLNWKGFLLNDDKLPQRMWPTFDCDPETAVRRYWRIYNYRVEELCDRFPRRVHQVEIDALNSETGQSTIMSMAAIPFEARRFLKEAKQNARGSRTEKQRRIAHRVRQAEAMRS